MQAMVNDLNAIKRAFFILLEQPDFGEAALLHNPSIYLTWTPCKLHQCVPDDNFRV
jgi:hypothetical protein